MAGPGLLDTYDAERRPIGALMVEQAYTRYVTRVAPYLGTDGMQPIVDDFALELGCRCNSPAVVLEPGDDTRCTQHPRESKGHPGSRAPHVFLKRAGERISTLDLFGRGFVMLAAPSGESWHRAAVAAGDALDAPIESFVVGGAELADPDGAFPDAYGLSDAGAVLVRPDGVIGWRSVTADGDSERAVREALGQLLCRGAAVDPSVHVA